ncbi:hypothetical protein ACERZ8_20240 [Tateyamaria armeniaca]|uniref:Uncharacterized protein n=1 Tax=Tateyamaria armeniaca TaxID=2518930 RepID=A0ABW8V265_9RHOB
MPNDDVDPLVLVQTKWLKDFESKFELSAGNLEMMDQRKAGQAAIQTLDAQKEGIRDALMGIKVTVKGGPFGIGGKKMKLLEGEGDYRAEIDTVHHGKKMKEAMSPEQSNIVKAQLDKITAIRAQLDGNPYYDAGERPAMIEAPERTDDMSDIEYDDLFRKYTEDCIAQEKEWEAKVAECERHVTEDLWTPMVREGVIPENLVPQKNSEVATLFENSAAAYDERLDEYAADLTDADLLQQKFDLGFKIGNSVLKFAGSLNEFSGAVGGDGVQDGVGVASDVFEYMGIAMTLGEGVAKAVITDKDYIGVGLAIADAAAATIGKASDSDTAGIIGSVIENGARSVRVGQKLSADPPDYEGAFMDVVEGVSSELERNDPDDDGGLMSDIAAGLTTSATAAFQSKNIAAMVQRGDPPLAILSAIMDAGDTLGSYALSKAGVIKDDEDGGDGDEGPDEGELSQDIMDGLAALNGKFDEDKRAEIEARTKEMDIVAAERLKEAAEAAAAEEQAQFEMHLRMGFPLATDDQEAADIAEFERVNSIEFLIAMQKKNEATFAMCEQIKDKGMAFVEKLFPPAALVSACITLALTIKSAIEQTQEMIMWRENVADAMTAVSPQVDAMLNRSGLQTKQAMQQNVQAALDAAKVVAEVLKLTPGAPAAPIVSASVGAIEAGIELADLIYTEVQLNAAWKIYQQAQATPDDRYLAREALRENPTLSKYAMAYGSLNGDAIAIEGMRRCGLNKQVLANPDTNIAKVVTYLESKYPDDPVLLRANPPSDKWYPGNIELNAQNWMLFYQAAISDAELDPGGDTSGVAAALGRLDEAETAFEAALKDVAERAKTTTVSAHKETPVVIDTSAKDTLLISLIQVRGKLDGYKPKQLGGSVAHDSMAAYVDALRAKAEQRTGSVNRIVDSAPWTSKLQKDPETTGG